MSRFVITTAFFMKSKSLPTATYLGECFVYDQILGSLTWRRRPVSHFPNPKSCDIWNTRWAGQLAGKVDFSVRGSYVRIKIAHEMYRAHRIIWKIMTGLDPVDEIDHIDRNGLNNKWSNLREATREQNCRNEGNKRNNTSGIKGVSFHFGKWRARINLYGSEISLGRYDTQEEARLAYHDGIAKLHGDFANPG